MVNVKICGHKANSVTNHHRVGAIISCYKSYYLCLMNYVEHENIWP